MVSQHREAGLPTTWEPSAPYLDGPQPRMLRLKGHDLGRVRNAEQHIEALVLLQDPPCGNPKDFSAPDPFLREMTEALLRPHTSPNPRGTGRPSVVLRPPPHCTLHPHPSPDQGAHAILSTLWSQVARSKSHGPG